jgi:hypothetical protein
LRVLDILEAASQSLRSGGALVAPNSADLTVGSLS